MVARYDAYGPGEDDDDGAAVAALLALIGPTPGPRALDVACGHGLVARELARRGATVTGIDVSDRLLERARALAGDGAPPVDYVLGDATDHEVVSGSELELVTSNFGLSDIDDSTVCAPRSPGCWCRAAGSCSRSSPVPRRGRRRVRRGRPTRLPGRRVPTNAEHLTAPQPARRARAASRSTARRRVSSDVGAVRIAATVSVR